MPYLTLTTNVPTETHPTNLLPKLSTLMAKETGKPESYVMVSTQYNPNMLFAGTDAPLAYLECKSIGLTASQAKNLSASLSEILSETLRINSNRVYIEFSNCPGNYWGWDGSTF
jgi:phenylpyruvate tautomerase